MPKEILLDYGDNKTMTRMLKTVLAFDEFNVTSVKGSEEILKQIETKGNSVGAILIGVTKIGVGKPLFTGVETARQLLAAERVRDIPRIFLTTCTPADIEKNIPDISKLVVRTCYLFSMDVSELSDTLKELL